MKLLNENIRFNTQSTKRAASEKIVNRFVNECGAPASSGPVTLNPHKRKIDANTISEVTAHKKSRLDNVLNRMKRISNRLELAQNPTNEGSLPTFTESPVYIENGKMRDYQIAGLNWLIASHEHGLSAILGDEMGLGKTLQTISLIGYLQLIRKVDGRFLIVVPLTTITNWENEFQRWCPSLTVVSVYGSETVRRQVINTILNNDSDFAWDVCLTTYETCKLAYTQRFFNHIRWYYVILDEGTRINNEEMAMAHAISLLKAKHRLILTGTPVNNKLHELWALLSFLMPNEFVSSIEFDEWFDDEACLANDATVLNNLRTILKPLLLRRLKSEVEIIKPYQVVDVLVNMTHLQRNWYRKILLKNIDIVRGTGQDIKFPPLWSMFLQLRKCTNHPYLFEGAETGPPFISGEHIVSNSGKMLVLDMLLAKLKRRQSRVLIFCQSIHVMDIIEDYLTLRPEYEYSRLDGRVAIDERTNRIAEFQDLRSKKFIFLLCTKTGGLGINLTAADSVIIYDSDWNPQMDLQAISRAHRIGQTKQLRVFRLIAKDTVDEKMIQRADTKLQLSDIVIGSQVNPRLVVPPNFVLNAVRFGADAILSNDSSDDDAEWDKLVKRNSQKLVDQIFEN